MTDTSNRTSTQPVVILTPEPQRAGRIFDEQTRAEFERLFHVIDLEGKPDALDDALPETFAIVGQPDLPTERIARAPRFRALVNVEGNFYPNVDYPTCFDRGIYVLGCGPAYATAVAEYSLGLALDLARGIGREDRAFRANRER